MDRRKYGSKYERGLDVTEIAKRIRADLKAAVKAGELPAAKYRVKCSRFAGGRSIDVTIDGQIDGIANAACFAATERFPHVYIAGELLPLYSPKGRKILDVVEAIVGAYNYDGSDTMSDYFDVNFYAHVGFSSAANDHARAAAVAAYDAGCAAIGPPEGLDFRGNPHGAIEEINRRVAHSNLLAEEEEVLRRAWASERH